MNLKKVFSSTVGRFPKIAQLTFDVYDALDRNAEFLESPWGFKLAGNKEMAAGTFEVVETSIIKNLVNEVELFVNIGANIGYYCCHALEMHKDVIAFEPNPRNFNYLLKNIYENGWSHKAEVFPIALGDSVNILEMWGGWTGASLVKGWANNPQTQVRRVPVNTLDNILLSRINRLKTLIVVDVEGFELNVLKGAHKVLASNPRPIWFIEVASRNHLPEEFAYNQNILATFELMFSHGYSCYEATEIGRQIFLQDVRAHILLDRDNDWPNNFIFR